MLLYVSTSRSTGVNNIRNLGILLALYPFLLSLYFFWVNCNPGPTDVKKDLLSLLLLLGLVPPIITTPTTRSPQEEMH